MQQIAVEEDPKNKSSKGCFSAVKGYWRTFTEYSGESTIHSVNYIGKRDAHWGTRLFWIFCFVVSLSVCIYLGTQTYIRWKNNPVIMAIDQVQTHVSDIPFPAVTLCASNEKIDEEKFNLPDIVQRYANNQTLTRQEEAMIKLLDDIKKEWTIHALDDDIKIYDPKYNLTSKDYIDNLNNITREFITSLTYRKVEKNGSEVFRRTIFEENLCFTYNMIEDDDMFTEKIAETLIDHGEYDSQYVPKSGEEYLQRVKSARITQSINIRIALDNTDNLANMTSIFMIIHSPYNYPKYSMDFIPIKLGAINKILITPQIIQTDEELIKYKPKVRECIFGYKTKLEFFKNYTQSNCELECETHYLLQKCSCVLFHMLHNESTRICQTEDEIDCADNATDLFHYTERRLKRCKCLPHCNEITYSMSMTHYEGKITRDESYESVIVLGYKTDRFVALKRQEVFGLVEFLSSIGGFLGLLMGGSLLSLIEIFYHFFMRKCCKEKGDDQEETRLNNDENGAADNGAFNRN
ncbi:CLUMA_CG018791, isoform A [Clunio marinus]|uniref:CLUMA_CG018791, isoform A n=1 Tax=Clunio marinus TaxID=568069 RepID=A0A1J1J1F1_9DIPT|nr:CLUMA_CG018791, isoform A [Clunio marinus]